MSIHPAPESFAVVFAHLVTKKIGFCALNVTVKKSSVHFVYQLQAMNLQIFYTNSSDYTTHAHISFMPGLSRATNGC